MHKPNTGIVTEETFTLKTFKFLGEGEGLGLSLHPVQCQHSVSDGNHLGAFLFLLLLWKAVGTMHVQLCVRKEAASHCLA